MNNWRAVAHAYYGDQHLIYMGSSMEQVRKNYPGAFYEILQGGEQMGINRITLEKWNGKPDSGFWSTQDVMKVPRVNRQVQK
jgi:hypothetical protein